MTKWYLPSKPSELQPVPWLAPAVIAYLESIIQPEWEVIEHGSGGSTLWFADRCEHVTAIERNPAWREAVQKQAPGADVLGDTPPIAFHEDCDLLLIDGEPIEARKEWIKDAPFIVRPGGWIVLDNANRPEYKTERKALLDHSDLIKTFDGNEGGTNHLVTEFYRAKKGSE